MILKIDPTISHGLHSGYFLFHFHYFDASNPNPGFMLTYSYYTIQGVMKIVKDLGIKILEQDFGESGRMKISLPVRHKEKLMSRLNLMQAVGKKIKWHN